MIYTLELLQQTNMYSTTILIYFKHKHNMYVYLLSMYCHVIYCLIRILTSYYIFQMYCFSFQYLTKDGVSIDGTET